MGGEEHDKKGPEKHEPAAGGGTPSPPVSSAAMAKKEPAQLSQPVSLKEPATHTFARLTYQCNSYCHTQDCSRGDEGNGGAARIYIYIYI